MSGKKKKKKYWTTCKTALKAVITCSWLVARVSPQGHAAGSDSPAAALGVPWPFDRELQQGSLTAPQSSPWSIHPPVCPNSTWKQLSSAIN